MLQKSVVFYVIVKHFILLIGTQEKRVHEPFWVPVLTLGNADIDDVQVLLWSYLNDNDSINTAS